MLYKETPAYETFQVIDGILCVGTMPLTDKQKFQLKSEALAFKGTLLFKLLGEKEVNNMQQRITDEARTLEDISAFRAILADRRIMLAEIDEWATAKLPIPTLDTLKPLTV